MFSCTHTYAIAYRVIILYFFILKPKHTKVALDCVITIQPSYNSVLIMHTNQGVLFMAALGQMYLYCTARVSLWAAASSVLIEFERHSADLLQVGASEPKGHPDWTNLNGCPSHPLRSCWLWAWLGSDWCVHLKSAPSKSMKNEMPQNCMSSGTYIQWNQLWWDTCMWMLTGG